MIDDESDNTEYDTRTSDQAVSQGEERAPQVPSRGTSRDGASFVSLR